MRAEAERWFRFAEEDLRVAALVFEEQIYTQTCFHAQQAVEKILKGLLVYQERLPPKTHALLYLWEQLSPNPLSDFKEEISLLNLFYAPTRYPDALPGSLPDGYPSKDIAEKALQWATAIYQRAQEYIKRSAIE
ncbi:hypothetical protein HRbin16_01712 [bacterium HR16]|nr:hypothetical protein HRbin16_01712 [bacterium HR16]